MQKPEHSDGNGRLWRRDKEQEKRARQGKAAPTAATPDGAGEQSAIEAFDEEGAGIAAKE